MTYRLYQIAYIPPKNSASLTADIDDSQTIISVDDASTFPTDSSTDEYFIYLRGEFMYLTATNTTNDTITVERGSLGTAPKVHDQSEAIYEGVIKSGTDERDLRYLDEATNFKVDEVGEIEQSLEFEEAKFKVSNTSVTLKGLGRGRLSDTGSIHRPWVFEIVDGGSTVFSGIVDSNGLTFDAATRTTSFDVISWLELLDRAESVPARYIYETEVRDAWLSEEDENDVTSAGREVMIEYDDDQLPSEVGDAGDIAVIETNDTEIRTPIVWKLDNPSTSFPISIIQQAKPEGDGEIFRSYPTSGGIGSGDTIVPVREKFQPYTEYRMYVTDKTTIQDLATRLELDLEQVHWTDPIKLGGDSALNFDISLYNSSDEVLWEREVDSIRIERKRNDASGTGGIDSPFEDGQLVLSLFLLQTNSVANIDGWTIDVRRDSTANLVKQLESGDTINILGSLIYGYGGETYDVVVDTSEVFGSAFIPKNYDTKTLIKSLFTLNDLSQGRPKLGVLPQVFNSTEFDNLNSTKTVPPMESEVQYPTEGLEALRMLQQRGKFLLKETFVSKTNSNNNPIPSYAPEMILRNSMFATATEVSDRKITEWEEDLSENNVDAVKVTTNEDYLKGQGGINVDERMGFYFDGIEEFEKGTTSAEEDRSLMGPPSGENVVEIEVPVLPSKSTGFIYSGGEDTVENNPALKRIAKFYYEHFNKANRSVRLTYGENGTEWIGGYWYFKNQGRIIDDLVFVTSETKSVSENSIDSQLEGRIGTNDPSLSDAAPVAKISGPREFRLGNSTGDVVVSLNGGDSYCISEGELTYKWERKAVGGTYATVQADGQLLTDNGVDASTVNRYVYRLTVTNGQSGLQDTATQNVIVGPRAGAPDPDINLPEAAANGWQEAAQGVMRLHVARPEYVKRVLSRKAIGENLTASDGFSEVQRHRDTIASIDTTGNVITINAERSRYYEGSGIVDLDDGTGNLTRFTVTNISQAGGQTEITVESISSTSYTDVVGPFYIQKVDLSNKHTSVIEYRITHGGGGRNVETFSNTFDFDNLPEAELSPFTDQKGSLFADIVPDEDVNKYKIEYQINTGGWVTDSTGNTGSLLSYKIFDAANVTVNDGDKLEVRVTAENTEGETNKIVRATYYNRNEGGSTTFDSIEITSAGTIDGVQTDVFRFLDTNGQDGATIDVDNVQINQINGTALSKYARTDQNESITGAWDFKTPLEIYAASSHFDLIETDANNKRWRFEVLSQDFAITEVGAALQFRIKSGGEIVANKGITAGGDVQANGSLLQSGNQAAIITNNHTVTGTWTFNNRIKFADGTAGRIMWDENKSGDPLFIQREATTSETSIAAVGTQVGIDEVTSPSYSLDVGGNVYSSDSYISNGDMRHDNFAGGWTGSKYRITDAGAITAGSLFLRGTLTVSELVVNRIHAVDGTQIIGPGRGRIETVTGSAPQETVTLEDPEGTGVTSFVAGDIVIVQEVDIDNDGSTPVKRLVREVASVDNTSATVTFQALSDAPADTGSFAQGDTLLSIGNTSDTSRQSVLVATATNNNAPYRRTIDGVNSWTAWQNSDKITTQTGNLNGSYGYDSDTYGIAAGDPTAQHITVDPSGVRLIDNNTTRASLTSSSLVIGAPGEDHAIVDSTSLRLIDNNTTRAELSGDTLTLGNTTRNEYVQVDPTNGVQIFDEGANVAAQISGNTLSVGNNFTYNASTTTLTVAGWTVNTNRINRTFNGTDLIMGEPDSGLPEPIIETSSEGFVAEDGSDAVMMGEIADQGSGGMGLLAWTGSGGVSTQTENYVAIGKPSGLRSSMGITVAAGGNTVFYTNSTTAYIDNLELRTLTVAGVLTMGSSGKITNSTNDFTLDDMGFEIPTQDTLSETSAYTIRDQSASQVAGRLWGDDDGAQIRLSTVSPYGILLFSAGDLELASTNNLVYTRDSVVFRTGGGFEFDPDHTSGNEPTFKMLGHHSNQLTQSDVPQGEAHLYVYEKSTSDWNFRVAFHHPDGSFEDLYAFG